MRILSSLALVVLVAALGALAAGETFSQFTGSSSASGPVTAATVAITVNGSGGAGVLSFSPSPAASWSCDAVLPGEKCADVNVKVVNGGTVPFYIDSAEVVIDGGGVGCSLANIASDGNYGTLEGQTVPAGGESSTVSVTMRLVAGAPNACQGKSFSATLTVTGYGVP